MDVDSGERTVEMATLFGQRLRERLRAVKKTQKKASDESKVSTRTWSDAVKGVRASGKPTILDELTLDAMAIPLGVTSEEIELLYLGKLDDWRAGVPIDLFSGEPSLPPREQPDLSKLVGVLAERVDALERKVEACLRQPDCAQ